jgi:hypothetical protein
MRTRMKRLEGMARPERDRMLPRSPHHVDGDLEGLVLQRLDDFHQRLSVVLRDVEAVTLVPFPYLHSREGGREEEAGVENERMSDGER